MSVCPQRPIRAIVSGGLLVLAGLVLAGGCNVPAGPAANPTMTEALGQPVTVQPGTVPLGKVPPGRPAPAAAAVPVNPPNIATVNGRPIAYDVWFNLLRRAHGQSALQQVLAVELARQGAEAKGITLTQAQLDEAYRQEMAEIAGPEFKESAEQERILQAILARRNIGMEEFRLSAYRNAYLRRIVEPIVERSIDETALKAEFDRLYGEKVQIRHIQMSDSEKVSQVLQLLDQGADFAETAKRFSENLDSAPEGGLLLPFSRLDPGVPAAVRELAFAAEVGKVAGPVRVEGWSQIIRIEARIPAQPVEYEKVAGEVRQALKEQLVRQQMQQLLQSMLQSAVIEVHDQEMNKAFQALKAAKP